jgi:hypothetical protein
MKSLEKREEIFKDVQLVITRIVSACILPRLDLIVRANLRHGAKSLPYSSWSIACAQSEADFETTMSDLSSLASSDYAFSQKSCSLSRLTTFTLDVETISSISYTTRELAIHLSPSRKLIACLQAATEEFKRGLNTQLNTVISAFSSPRYRAAFCRSIGAGISPWSRAA